MFICIRIKRKTITFSHDIKSDTKSLKFLKKDMHRLNSDGPLNQVDPTLKMSQE